MLMKWSWGFSSEKVEIESLNKGCELYVSLGTFVGKACIIYI